MGGFSWCFFLAGATPCFHRKKINPRGGHHGWENNRRHLYGVRFLVRKGPAFWGHLGTLGRSDGRTLRGRLCLEVSGYITILLGVVDVASWSYFLSG